MNMIHGMQMICWQSSNYTKGEINERSFSNPNQRYPPRYSAWKTILCIWQFLWNMIVFKMDMLMILNLLWGNMTALCFRCIGSDNGLSPVGQQAIIWTNADILTYLAKEHISMKFHFKVESFYSGKWISKCRLQNGTLFSRPQCISQTTKSPI